MNERIRKKLEVMIDTLKAIHEEIEEHYFDDEWDLSDEQYDILYRITGYEEHDWDDSNLAHFIDGMERAIHLIEII